MRTSQPALNLAGTDCKTPASDSPRKRFDVVVSRPLVVTCNMIMQSRVKPAGGERETRVQTAQPV